MEYLDLDAWYAYYSSEFLLLKQSMRLELESFVVLLKSSFAAWLGMCVILEQIVIISEKVVGLLYLLYLFNNLFLLCNVE